MEKIIVLCDDLTGCGDIAYWSLKKDLTTLISSSDANYQNILKKSAQVYVFNLNTRNLSQVDAYNKTKQVLENLDIDSFIYKKMDSTLRGNFACENDVFFDVLNISWLPLVAAFPEQNRTTKKGIHYVNGIEINKTEFRFDPVSPVYNSHIPTLLRTHSQYANKTQVFDASSIENMNNISNYVQKKWKQEKFKYRVATGSSKFFDVLININANNNISSYKKYNKFVIISGSLNLVTIKQINKLILQLDLKQNSTEITNYSNEYITLLYGNIFSKNFNIKDFISQNFISRDTLFILCGGHTSQVVFDAFDVKYAYAKYGVLPGISIVENEKMSFLLKPGGFGDEDFLEKFIKR